MQNVQNGARGGFWGPKRTGSRYGPENGHTGRKRPATPGPVTATSVCSVSAGDCEGLPGAAPHSPDAAQASLCPKTPCLGPELLPKTGCPIGETGLPNRGIRVTLIVKREFSPNHSPLDDNRGGHNASDDQSDAVRQSQKQPHWPRDGYCDFYRLLIDGGTTEPMRSRSQVENRSFFFLPTAVGREQENHNQPI